LGCIGFRHASALLLIVSLICTLSLPSASYQARVVSSMEAGKCRLTVEADDQERTLRLRAHPEGSNCHITKDAMLTALGAAFSRTEPPRMEGTYSSLSIGRLIDYPWLSQHLALAAHKDKQWDRKSGKPVAMHINTYVSSILSGREVTAQIERALAGSGYRVISAIVEKVLVGGFRNVPLYPGEMAPGKVPYDAQVWFKLKKE
jgi:hypothetical protein